MCLETCNYQTQEKLRWDILKYGIHAIRETDVRGGFRDYDNFRTTDNCFPSLCRIDEVIFSANPRATAGFFRGEFRNSVYTFLICLQGNRFLLTLNFVGRGLSILNCLGSAVLPWISRDINLWSRGR